MLRKLTTEIKTVVKYNSDFVHTQKRKQVLHSCFLLFEVLLTSPFVITMTSIVNQSTESTGGGDFAQMLWSERHYTP